MLVKMKGSLTWKCYPSGIAKNIGKGNEALEQQEGSAHFVLSQLHSILKTLLLVIADVVPGICITFTSILHIISERAYPKYKQMRSQVKII